MLSGQERLNVNRWAVKAQSAQQQPCTPQSDTPTLLYAQSPRPAGRSPRVSLRRWCSGSASRTLHQLTGRKEPSDVRH
eukprot:365377-Chlamydomonas_euryale.AAC.27